MTPGLSLPIGRSVTEGTSSRRNSCAYAAVAKPAMAIKGRTSRIENSNVQIDRVCRNASVVLTTAKEIIRIDAARPGCRLLLVIPLLVSEQTEQRRRSRRRTWRLHVAGRIITLPAVSGPAIVILLVAVLARRITAVAAVVIAALHVITTALLVAIGLGFHARHQIVLVIDLAAAGVEAHVFGERIRRLRGERIACVIIDRDGDKLTARLRRGLRQRGSRRVGLPHRLHHRLEDRDCDLAAGRAAPE